MTSELTKAEAALRAERERSIAERDHASLRRAAEESRDLNDQQRAALLLLADMMELAKKAGVRRLLCVGFIHQFPTIWKCTHCKWLYRLDVNQSVPTYASHPPKDVLEKFAGHRCGE